MSIHQYVTIGDTVYFWFGANDTSGSGGDGASAAADVRLAGAAASAIPVESLTPDLLTHANFPPGCYELAILLDGDYADGSVYSVFTTLLIDSQNPTGFIGSFSINPIKSDLVKMGGVAQSATDLKDFADAGYDPGTNKVQGVVLVDSVTDGLTTANVNVAAGVVESNVKQLDGSAVQQTTGHLHTFDDAGAALSTSAQADRNMALIESQRKSHTAQGSLFYVDPFGGATHASGARGGKSDPYLTIQDCHDNAVTAWAHDVIWLIAGDTDSLTTHTIAGTTTISKAYTFIRGPGRDMLVTRTGNGDTLAATADGVEFSGFRLQTAATGAGNGITITDSDFVLVQDLWIESVRGDGVNMLRADNAQIMGNVFLDVGQNGNGSGIHIIGTAGTSNHNVICDNLFNDCVVDGILIEDGTTHHTHICKNEIHGTGGWDINIGASSVDAFVSDNHLSGDGSGAIQDNGTTTKDQNNQQWGKQSNVLLIEADTNELQQDWADGGRLDLILDDIPNTAEFEARTILAAAYFDPAADAVANVTAVGTLSGHTPQTGDSYAIVSNGTHGNAALLARGDIAWITGGGASAADIADAVWDELQAEHVIAGSFGVFLDASISGVGGAVGPGGTDWTININDGVNPIDNVKVWLTTDEIGSNTVAGTQLTNADGDVKFKLDSGVTYYTWKEKAGFNFTNPVATTVS